MRIFGQTGAHAINIAADIDHEFRVDQLIQHLKYTQDRQRRVKEILNSVGLSASDLTEDDLARIEQELG